MRWVAGAIGVLAASTGVTVWVRWLIVRRGLWFTRLNNAIPVHAQYWRDHATKHGELLYVALGDSAAQGIGASTPGRGYVGFIAQHLRRTTSTRWRVANLGIAGATLGIALAKQLPGLAKLEADVLTVAIGANDIAAFEPIRFERQLRELFAALPGHAIVAEVPSFYFLPRERLARQANEIVRRVAREHGLAVAPLHRITRRQGMRGVITQFAGDLFHPNDRGYRVWAAAFTPALDARLAELGVLDRAGAGGG